MTFKKGDIVEVIEIDKFYEVEYPVGSRWEVIEQVRTILVIVKDESQPWGEASLWLDSVKKFKEEKQ